MNQTNTQLKRVSRPRWSIRFTSLRTRLLVTSILLVLLPVSITGAVATYISSQGLTADVFDQLESVVTLKESQVHDWLASLQTNLDMVFVNVDSLKRVSELVLNQEPDEQQKDLVRTELTNNSQRSGYFTEIFVMDKDGQVIVSTESNQEGKILTTQSFFHEGIKGRYITPPSYELSLSNYTIVISQPLVSNTGKTIGVVAGRVNLNTLDEIMQQRTGLGETGETYMVSSNFAVLTKLRFGETVLGQTYIHTDGVTNAIKSKANGSGSYPDYRNTAVAGVYHWVPELQVAIIAEQDESEALSAASRVFQVTLGLIVITVLAAGFAAFLTTQSITAPVTKLATAAENIAKGNLDQHVDIIQQDEIGVLANSFNSMTSRLRELITTLEQRVADRTKALATSSEVSRRLSTILDQRQLVTEVVEQVKNSFNYYHAHIYMYDEEHGELVMAGGTGEAGATMLANGHKLSKGQGLVGRAAESNEPILVNDTSRDPNWLPNPLLPETKSEVAMPISIGNKVLGVLDIQHNIVDGLKREDVDSLQSIANQVAIALQNIGSVETMTKRAKELASVAEISTVSSREADINRMLENVVYLTQRRFGLYHAHVFLYDRNANHLQIIACGWKEGDEHEGTHGTTIIPLLQEQSLVARAARTKQAVIINDVHNEPGWLPNPLLPDTASELAVPLLVGDQLIGVLDVQSDRLNAFTEEDANIQTTLASQIAVTVQNARTLIQSKRQAERETLVNIITQKIQNATTVEDALQVAARELGHAMGMKSTIVRLDTAPNSSAEPSSLS
ncbi:MAG TPA: GAF domain-containing protein [Anaerolineales bacterium]|nr:GAF domain-containing protein [Anaerolineales bacterium]